MIKKIGPLFKILLICTLVYSCSFSSIKNQRRLASVSDGRGKEFYEIPKIKSNQEKLEFLLRIQKEIPSLLVDAAKYKIDLFELLELQEELQESYFSRDGYRDEMNYYHANHVEITVVPKKNELVSSYSVDPKELEALRWKLRERFTKLQSFTRLDQELQSGLKALGHMSASGLKTGMILSLDKEKQKEAFVMKDQKMLLAFLEKELPLTLPDNFNGKNFGFLKNPKKHDVLKKFIQLKQAESSLAELLALKLLSHEVKGSFFSSLLLVDKSKLSLFSDREALKIRFNLLKMGEYKEYSKLLNENVINITESFFRDYSSKVIRTQEKLVDGLILKEVPPGMGLFRGFLGGDCATSRSFSYPNLPTEKVFFIYDQKMNPKGYLSGFVGNLGDELTFKVMAINGAKISGRDIPLILEGLAQIKEYLGVLKIALPSLDRVDNLVNFDEIKMTLKETIGKEKEHVIKYLDDDLRDHMAKYEVKYNKSDYDNMDLNYKTTVFKENKIQVDSKFKINKFILNESVVPKKYEELDFLLKSNIFLGELGERIESFQNIKDEYLELTKTNQEVRELFLKYKKYLNYKEEDFLNVFRDYFAYFIKTSDLGEFANGASIDLFKNLDDSKLQQLFNQIKKPSSELIERLLYSGDHRVIKYTLTHLGNKSEGHLDSLFNKIFKQLEDDEITIIFASMKNKLSDEFYNKNFIYLMEKKHPSIQSALVSKMSVVEDLKIVHYILDNMDNSFVSSLLSVNLGGHPELVNIDVLKKILKREDKNLNRKIVEQIFTKEWSVKYNDIYSEIINDKKNFITVDLLVRLPLFANMKNMEEELLKRIDIEAKGNLLGQDVRNILRSLYLDDKLIHNAKLSKLLLDKYKTEALEMLLSSKYYINNQTYNKKAGMELVNYIKHSKERTQYLDLIFKKTFTSYGYPSGKFIEDLVSNLNKNEVEKFLGSFFEQRVYYPDNVQLNILEKIVEDHKNWIKNDKVLMDKMDTYLKKVNSYYSIEVNRIKKLVAVPAKIIKIEKITNQNCVELLQNFIR